MLFRFCLQTAWGAITDKFWTILALIEEAELWTQKFVVLPDSLTPIAHFSALMSIEFWALTCAWGVTTAQF